MKKYVNGLEVEMTPNEISQRQAEESAWPSKQAKTNILNQINLLESSITTRRIREALVSGDNTFIVEVDTQIKALRNELDQGKIDE